MPDDACLALLRRTFYPAPKLPLAFQPIFMNARKLMEVF